MIRNIKRCLQLDTRTKKLLIRSMKHRNFIYNEMVSYIKNGNIDISGSKYDVMGKLNKYISNNFETTRDPGFVSGIRKEVSKDIIMAINKSKEEHGLSHIIDHINYHKLNLNRMSFRVYNDSHDEHSRIRFTVYSL